MFKKIPALIILTICLYAQDNGEIKLLGVNVEGNSITSASVIRYTSGLTEGKSITGAEFPRAVKRLWELGVFGDVQIHLDEETQEGIIITIQVEENYVLGQAHFEGNKKLKTSHFEEDLELTGGQRITPSTVSKIIRKLEELYAEKGYLKVEITGAVVDPLPPKATRKRRGYQPPPPMASPATKDIVFKIDENNKIRTGKIIFEGNAEFSDFRLRRVLKETKQQRWYLFWRSHFEEDKYEEDKLGLVTFYRNHGYRDFIVLNDTIGYSEDRKRMNIHLSVYEGPKYKFRKVTWEGNTLYGIDELNRRLDISRGTVYNEEDFNLAVYDRVQGLYMDKGYIYSQIMPQFTPVSNDSLDVHFQVVENHQVSVRQIRIAGNTKTRENVIRRELMIYPGDVFNREKLIQSQRKIFVLNYFADVVPDVIPVDEDEIDLEISVEERSSDRASANIGFSAEYGMTGGGGLEFNNFDLFHPFRSGNGQQFSISFNVGTQYNWSTTTQAARYRSFSINFIDPQVRDSRNLLGFGLFYTLRGQSSYYYFPLDIELRGGSIRWGRRFKWPDDYFRGTWVLQAVNRLYTGTEENLELYASGLSSTVGVNLTQIITRESRDHSEFPTRGSRMQWETTISGGILPGNEDYHKHILNLEWYTPTFSKFVLTSSLKIGVIQPLPAKEGEYSVVPLDEKFIMGGSGIPYGNMLRGYADNSIGPQSNGSPIGGNGLLKWTTEFRFPLSENPVIYVLTFAEAGNVWSTHQMEEPFNLSRSAALNLRRSVGAGIRFFMPMVGMLGFDMGYGFDDITGDGKPNGWNYHIIFGQQF